MARRRRCRMKKLLRRAAQVLGLRFHRHIAARWEGSLEKHCAGRVELTPRSRAIGKEANSPVGLAADRNVSISAIDSHPRIATAPVCAFDDPVATASRDPLDVVHACASRGANGIFPFRQSRPRMLHRLAGPPPRHSGKSDCWTSPRADQATRRRSSLQRTSRFSPKA